MQAGELDAQEEALEAGSILLQQQVSVQRREQTSKAAQHKPEDGDRVGLHFSRAQAGVDARRGGLSA